MTEVSQVPLLGNRLDRFIWNGATLAFDRNLLMLRAFQNDGGTTPPNQGDADQPPRGNHNAGVLRFGPDRKLYLIFGDQGRRGRLQNTTDLTPDDQFGGPEPDDAHFSGVVIRLNDDGSTPRDNPFFSAGAAVGGEAGANIQRIYTYGVRNSFGMAFDPKGGHLWYQENGEDAFDEINRAEPGMNGGWIQIAGPPSRVAEYRQIETTSLHGETAPNLQQLRWVRSGSRQRRSRPSRVCCCCRARITASRNAVGSTCWRREDSDSWTARDSAPNSGTICFWDLRSPFRSESAVPHAAHGQSTKHRREGSPA